MMYTDNDKNRIIENEEQDYRSPYRRDYARLIHSPSFRRLQGKTQLYPGIESDFFRNRLTHSLEVAQISKTIAQYINYKFIKEDSQNIDIDICEFAGVAHDLGHPPFGHQGEEALDECMRDYGGFEGNAQTLRILSKLEKKYKFDKKDSNKEYRVGLNLTYRSLASILKYDKEIPGVAENRSEDEKEKAVKGYYGLEADLVKDIKRHVLVNEHTGVFKTVECQIMDIADDIAYSTYDLEDGFKAGFYHPLQFLSYSDSVFENVAKKVTKALEKDKMVSKKVVTVKEVKEYLFSIFSTVFNYDFLEVIEDQNSGAKYISIPPNETKESLLDNLVNSVNIASKRVAEDGYIRGIFTSILINKAISKIQFQLDKNNPAMSVVYLDEDARINIEVLKNFTYESQILSPRLKVAEFRGKDIVKSIFELLSTPEGWRLMPFDYQDIYHHYDDIIDKKRCICDFIAGMTDKYAIEFYGRLNSENPETIFKPF